MDQWKSRSLVMAKLYLKNKDYKMAEQSFKEYLSLNPEDTNAMKLLAQVYEHNRRYEEAFELYERSYLAEPERSGVLLDICRILLISEIWLEDVDYHKWLNLAIQAFPSNPIVANYKSFLTTLPSKKTASPEKSSNSDKKEVARKSNDDVLLRILDKLSTLDDRLRTIEDKIGNLSISETSQKTQSSTQSSTQFPEANTAPKAIQASKEVHAPEEIQQPKDIQPPKVIQPPKDTQPSKPATSVFGQNTFGATEPSSPFGAPRQESLFGVPNQPALFGVCNPTNFFGVKSQLNQQGPQNSQSEGLTQTQTTSASLSTNSGATWSFTLSGSKENEKKNESDKAVTPTQTQERAVEKPATSEPPRTSIFDKGPPEASNPASPFGLSNQVSSTGLFASPFGAASPANNPMPSLFHDLNQPQTQSSGNLFADGLKKFGLPVEPNKWSFNLSEPKEAEKEDEGSEEEVAPTEELAIEQTCTMEPIAIKTGEEDEDVIFEHRCKLYRFRDKEYKERGLGSIKVLKHKETTKGRLIMRREVIGLVCLNCWDVRKIEKVRDNQVRWTGVDASDGEPTMTVFLVKFKTAEITDEFVTHLMNLFPDTPQATPQKASGPASDGPEVELVDPKLDQQLVDKARKLQLPDLFYHDLVNQKPCSGCDGCEKENQ